VVNRHSFILICQMVNWYLQLYCHWCLLRYSRDRRLDNHPGAGAVARLSGTEHCWRRCCGGMKSDNVMHAAVDPEC